jgi:hypothetical protein
MVKSPGNYDPRNPEHESQPMTDEELGVILSNSKLSDEVKKELSDNFGQDPWIKEQLLGICAKIDQEDWDAVSILWKTLEVHWKERRLTGKQGLVKFVKNFDVLSPQQLTKLVELIEKYPKMRERVERIETIAKTDKNNARALIENLQTDLENYGS